MNPFNLDPKNIQAYSGYVWLEKRSGEAATAGGIVLVTTAKEEALRVHSVGPECKYGIRENDLAWYESGVAIKIKGPHGGELVAVHENRIMGVITHDGRKLALNLPGPPMEHEKSNGTVEAEAAS